MRATIYLTRRSGPRYEEILPTTTSGQPFIPSKGHVVVRDGDKFIVSNVYWFDLGTERPSVLVYAEEAVETLR